MGKMTMDQSQSAIVDGTLQEELARGNRARRSLAPVFAHFLECDGPTLFSDAIIASLRGALDHIIRQLLTQTTNETAGALPQTAGPQTAGYQTAGPQTAGPQAAGYQALSNRLASDAVVIDHLYASALEGLIARSLEERSAIDPVLSPLLQELIASENPSIAELAMSVLAAQSRFCLNQRRMELPIGELPHEVFARVLEHLEAVVGQSNVSSEPDAIATLKSAYDEGANRVGLLARLASAMSGGAVAGLNLEHAGLALFASSCAALLFLERENAVFACHEGQSVRLALMLKAAGLSEASAARQIVVLGGTKPIPSVLSEMSQADALNVLVAHIEGAEAP